MSACKGKMQPVGLAQKQKQNKYSLQIGEVMLIYVCEDCGEISTNRIAADDRAEVIWNVFELSGYLSSCGCLEVRDTQVNMLNLKHADLVSRCLFGIEKHIVANQPHDEVPCLNGLILTE